MHDIILCRFDRNATFQFMSRWSICPWHRRRSADYNSWSVRTISLLIIHYFMSNILLHDFFVTLVWYNSKKDHLTVKGTYNLTLKNIWGWVADNVVRTSWLSHFFRQVENGKKYLRPILVGISWFPISQNVTKEMLFMGGGGIFRMLWYVLFRVQFIQAALFNTI